MKSGTHNKCIECDDLAVWVRSTQFAGDHPYCQKHAQEQDDFLINDSYTYWKEVKETGDA